ncbi:1,4-alpha-glucan branching protein GlgB [Propionivibrio soli]|uniref:1,4-alpha-glucan branching protein GlgB n=1 Tax=Propionivibrio soli TaxID=2976531 RepID=UPI0021E958FC|nr:1,4-alpha-glucan branching protein GlgB [Propionivibrio soli]
MMSVSRGLSPEAGASPLLGAERERLYERMGCQLSAQGARFSVWAPNARTVSVIGDFNNWNPQANALNACDDGSGCWEGFIPEVGRGDLYKFHIVSQDGQVLDKADPFAFFAELAPGTASRAWRPQYAWGDAEWMEARAARIAGGATERPISIYEVHLGSWRRPSGGLPNYREIAPLLTEYVAESGFTHVEILPLIEHPVYASQGYRATGYFAPTARYGTPEDFMFLIDALHRAGIGVILDWVPGNFSGDAYGLARFDGGFLYERVDPVRGAQAGRYPETFDHGREEVANFLLSSALFWLDRYHIDGLRIDAVDSMLYLDYGRRAGEWIPNREGGRENLEAVAFLQRLNEAIGREHPDVFTIAEESSAWPMVTRQTHLGGLGFSMAWNVEWMRDVLDFMHHDPLFRKFHHDALTASVQHAFRENFVVPLPHNVCWNGQGSLFSHMPGDDWLRFAGLRALYGFQWAYPGKKLLFMGNEFGQRREWSLEPWADTTLEWDALHDPWHGGLRRWVGDLNRLYRRYPALHEQDFDEAGFRWVDGSDRENSVLAFLRCAKDGSSILVLCNFTPVLRTNYVIGVPADGLWREALNSDAEIYGGSGAGNFGGAEAMPVPSHGQPMSLTLTLPPHAALFFAREERNAALAR